MTTGTSKTLTIAGHDITLTRGRRYLASRPMASGRNHITSYPVSIADITDGIAIDARPAAVIDRLDYDRANALLAAFNNGKTSFEGRVWK